MYQPAGRLRLSLAVATGVLFMCALVGCATSNPGPNGVPLGDGKTLRAGSTLSAQEASAAIAGMRTARVDGLDVANVWLSATEDGRLEATGYLGGSLSGWSTSNNKSYNLIALQVPQRVGSLKVEHAVPLVITDDTEITEAGKIISEAQLEDMVQDRWIKAVFSVQDGWIKADALQVLDREFSWGAWPDDYPPTAFLDESELLQDAKRPKGSGSYWLDVTTNGPPVTLTGQTNGAVTTDPPDQGLVGSVDLTIPDHLGPAAVYHLVQIFYRNAELMPAVDGSDGPGVAAKAVMQGGRLVAVP